MPNTRVTDRDIIDVLRGRAGEELRKAVVQAVDTDAETAARYRVWAESLGAWEPHAQRVREEIHRACDNRKPAFEARDSATRAHSGVPGAEKRRRAYFRPLLTRPAIAAAAIVAAIVAVAVVAARNPRHDRARELAGIEPANSLDRLYVDFSQSQPAMGPNSVLTTRCQTQSAMAGERSVIALEGESPRRRCVSRASSRSQRPMAA